MNIKSDKFKEEDQKALTEELEKTAETVKGTLGPNGKHVVTDENFGASVRTKDGLTVIREIKMKDEVKNAGPALLLTVASRTSDEAGDGTTTAAVLAQRLISDGLKYLSDGADPRSLKEGMEDATGKVLQELTNQSKEVSEIKEIEQIATVASNNDRAIGNLISGAVEKNGPDVTFTIQDSKGIETFLDYTEGLRPASGGTSPVNGTKPGGKTIKSDIGTACLHIGAASETEARERIKRTENAVNATRSALEKGFLSGGGISLIKASQKLNVQPGNSPDYNRGFELLKFALAAPLEIIADNGGYEGKAVVEKAGLKPDNHGFNAQNGRYEDLIEGGIIDPAGVLQIALKNAVSVACGLFLNKVTITQPETEETISSLDINASGIIDSGTLDKT